MPYEYKEGNNKVWTKTRSKLPADLCCDGCDERCKLSLSLQVEDKKYKPKTGSQQFVLKPIVRAGDRELYNICMFAIVKDFASEVRINFNDCNAKVIYQNALDWCRKTCKHSKLR